MSKLGKLKSLIFGERTSEFTSFFYLAKELGCLPDIIGRNYDVRDAKGELVFTIRQKPMTLVQARIFMSELSEHNKREEREARRVKNRRR